MRSAGTMLPNKWVYMCFVVQESELSTFGRGNESEICPSPGGLLRLSGTYGDLWWLVILVGCVLYICEG